jgi:hypothetical protein
MQHQIAQIACLPLLVLLSLVFLPNRWANRKVSTLRQVLTYLAALNAVAAVSIQPYSYGRW